MSIIQEYKKFALRGNVIDLAVGVVIGTAFGAITNSLVRDIIVPPFGWLTGGVDFSNLNIVLQEATQTTAAVTINYGQFLNTIFNFLIVSFVIFILIKEMNKLIHREEKKEKKKEPSEEILLLREIRDSLKK